MALELKGGSICSLGTVSRAQFLKKGAWLFRLTCNIDPPTARNSSEVTQIKNQSFYHCTGNGEPNCCFEQQNVDEAYCAYVMRVVHSSLR